MVKRGSIVVSVFASVVATAWLTTIASSARAAPSVWAIDDGEKIKRDATSLGFEAGRDNPVWSPGKPIRLFALRNETVAVQIVVEADDAALEGVTVDLARLASGRHAIENDPGATDPTRFVGRRIERFVEHYFTIARASGGKTAGESLGWAVGASPGKDQWTGVVPDALIPVEVAPSWSPYPMHIAPRTNGVVWIDVTVPATQAPGLYAGEVIVRAGKTDVAKLPIELEVADATLPDRTVKTMLYYERSALQKRIGDADKAERHLFQLYHRHLISPLHGGNDVAEIDRRMPAIDGSLYTAASGYEGAAMGVGDGVVSLGTYGSFEEPDGKDLAAVEAIADRLENKGIFASSDVFVYAVDEECESPWGPMWRKLLDGSKNEHARKIKVAWTCSEAPAKQPVDIPIVLELDAAKVSEARKAGKEVWAYNGMRPGSGTFLTDAEAVSPRVNPWLAATLGIGRWFYWESNYWYDGVHRGGEGPFDPFTKAETFHNKQGDFCAGDGVLVYPGKQVDMFTEHSLGMIGVVASIRLKNWRRGLEDAGYFQLARDADAAKADAVVAALFPPGKSSKSAPWSERGKAFFDARKALFDLVPRATGRGVDAGFAPPPPRVVDTGCGCRSGCAKPRVGAIFGALALGAALFTRRKKRED